MAELGTQQDMGKSKDAPSYPRDRVIAEGEAFLGYPSHVVTAALSMGRNAQKATFTQDEAMKAVQGFLDHEVEIDHPSQGG